jgi:hypothetical protein
MSIIKLTIKIIIKSFVPLSRFFILVSLIVWFSDAKYRCRKLKWLVECFLRILQLYIRFYLRLKEINGMSKVFPIIIIIMV